MPVEKARQLGQIIKPTQVASSTSPTHAHLAKNESVSSFKIMLLFGSKAEDLQGWEASARREPCKSWLPSSRRLLTSSERLRCTPCKQLLQRIQRRLQHCSWSLYQPLAHSSQQKRHGVLQKDLEDFGMSTNASSSPCV